MKDIERALERLIIHALKPNKVVLLLGARRVGKTELINRLLPKFKESYILLNGEDEDTHELLKQRTVRNYQRILGDTKLLIIDEAQDIPDIGAKLKLIVDTIEHVKILVTGSSVFDLNNTLGEPLVGRKTTLYMYPLAQMEYSFQENLIDTKSKFEERLILGTYPELEHIQDWNEKVNYLKEQVNSYLLKDILAFEGIKKREKLVSLLRMIAFRVGSEVSIESIGNDLQISKNSVDRYLDLLTKVFVIHKVTGFTRNLDNEITKKSKWYFYDNGIRNALINNFNLMHIRDDQGELWENYIISERLKYQEYNQIHTQNYFWRTHTRQEINWVEDREGKIHGYEFKWKSNKKIKVPALWKKAYQDASFNVISPDDYLDFVS